MKTAKIFLIALLTTLGARTVYGAANKKLTKKEGGQAGVTRDVVVCLDAASVPDYRHVSRRAVPQPTAVETLSMYRDINDALLAINHVVQDVFGGQLTLGDIAFDDQKCHLVALCARVADGFVKHYAVRSATAILDRLASIDATFRPESALTRLLICSWDGADIEFFRESLTTEATILGLFYELKTLLTKYLLCADKASDMFLFPKNNREVRDLHEKKYGTVFPYRIAEVTKAGQPVLLKKITDLLGQHAYLTNKSEACRFEEYARGLAKSNDEFRKNLGWYALRSMYEDFLLESFAKDVTRKVGCAFERLLGDAPWKGMVLHDGVRQHIEGIRHTILQLRGIPNGACSAANRHLLSSITNLIYDYRNFSSVSSLPAMYYIFEEIMNVFTKSCPAEGRSETEDLLEGLRFVAGRRHEAHQIFDRISEFLDIYETASRALPAGLATPCSEIKKSTDEVLSARLGDDGGTRGFGHLSDVDRRAQIDYIMKTYFPDETSQGHARKKSRAHARRAAGETPDRCPAHKKNNKKSTTARCDEDGSEYANAASTNEGGTAAGAVQACCVQEHASRPVAPRYDDRILRWFNPKFCEQHRNFCQANSCTGIGDCRHDIIYHTFAPSADVYLLNEGRCDYWQGNLRFSLPGKLMCNDGQGTFAIFSCTRGADGKIYHRQYRPTTPQRITDEFHIEATQTNIAIGGPASTDHESLNVVSRSRAVRVATIAAETPHYVIINDPANDIRVILFKCGHHDNPGGPANA